MNPLNRGIADIVNEAVSNASLQLYQDCIRSHIVIDIIEDDCFLKTDKESSACSLHSVLHPILRIPELKNRFMKSVEKSDDNYFFVFNHKSNKLVFRIPISHIRDEKDKGENKLFHSNNEFVLACGVYLLSFCYYHIKFVDRIAYQVILGVDAFFWEKAYEIDHGVEILEGNDHQPILKGTKTMSYLHQDGSITLSSHNIRLEGFYIIILGHYKYNEEQKIRIGHATTIYFDTEKHSWYHFNCRRDIGETKIFNSVQKQFNSLAQIIGVGTESRISNP